MTVSLNLYFLNVEPLKLETFYFQISFAKKRKPVDHRKTFVSINFRELIHDKISEDKFSLNQKYYFS